MLKYAPYNMTREELVAYTPEWTGDRFEDGRPRVPDDILERMRQVTVTQAWGVLRNEGYEWQFEGDWVCTHPGQTLVGRAVTANYLPRRPVLRRVMEEVGAQWGCVGDQISWPIDLLVPGDVYVADTFGKIDQGPIAGDNLSTAILANSGNGIVLDGSVRDLEGIQELPGFASFVRGWHPSYASPTIMLAGINVPVRVGPATVMPGDVVLGKRMGVVFVPPHLAELLVTTAEIIRLRDQFGKQRLRERVYTPGEIDRQWTADIEADFGRWLEAHIDDLPVPRRTIQDYLKKRTW